MDAHRVAQTLPNVNASSETLSSNSTVGITINGTTPGDGVKAGTYTQLKVSGAINLNGAPLSITHSATTAKGTTFIIVHSTDGVSGTFNGLNEGATATASDGTEFSISYKGNGGKEVVLTQITPSPQAPTFTSANSTTFTVGSAGSFTVKASGYPAPTLSESGSDNLPGGVKFNASTGVLRGTPAAGSSGTYTLNFTATNSSGSVSRTFTLTVNQAPNITSGNSVTFTAGQFSSFTVTATGSPAPSLKESGALPSGITFTDNGDGTAALGGAPDADTHGTYKFSITASNGVGSAFTQTFTLTVNQPPTFTSANSTTFTVGSAGSFTVKASGYPAPTLSESSSDNLPGGVEFNASTGVLSGTPAAGSSGTYTLNFTATNSAGSVFQTVTLTVNQAPAITSGNSVSFVTGQFSSFTVTATGSPAPSLKESGALPSGVSFTDNGDGMATLAGSPAAGTTGTYHFSITASNGVGSDFTQHFTLTVNQPEAPAIMTGNSTVFTVDQVGSFTVRATGSPTPTLSESGALPSGVTFTDNSDGTATLGGTPVAGTKGTYQFSITAHNGVGSDFVQSFMLTVNQSQAPTITSGSRATFTVGQGASFTVTATGWPTPSLKESGALSRGVTFTNNGNGTATLGGVASAGTNGTYHFSIIANNGVGSVFTQSFTLTVNASPPPPPPPPPPSNQPPTHSAPPVLQVPPLVAFFNSLLGALETINANGTETVTDNFLGVPLVVATYDSTGNFVSATLLGINLPNWVWNL
jgi:hypothetical protein